MHGNTLLTHANLFPAGEGKDGGGDRKAKGMVVSIEWYDGAEGLLHQRVPTLCIALAGGTIQLSRGVDDLDPIVVHCHMEIRQVKLRFAVDTSQ